MFQKLIPAGLYLILCGGAAGIATAAEPSTAPATESSPPVAMSAADLLIRRIDALGGLSQAQADARVRGKKLTTRCQICHGIEGTESSTDEQMTGIPNLAQQPPLYLLKQLLRFNSEQRGNVVMHGVTDKLDDDAMVSLALYYSSYSLDVEQPLVKKADKQTAKAIYDRLCVHCHGADAGGQAGIPRLWGQNGNYIKRWLRGFRNKEIARPHGGMSTAARDLSDAEINALAAYLSWLSPKP